VQAFLLRPIEARGPLPGVLAIHQDGATRPYAHAKSEPVGVGGDPELAYGLELCLRGYVVLCPDRFPYESRSLAASPFKEQFDAFRIRRCDPGSHVELTEDLYRGCVANRLLVEGWTALGKELLELRRALDCLAAQPGVDAAPRPPPRERRWARAIPAPRRPIRGATGRPSDFHATLT
jgi:hypothetical protein